MNLSRRNIAVLLAASLWLIHNSIVKLRKKQVDTKIAYRQFKQFSMHHLVDFTLNLFILIFYLPVYIFFFVRAACQTVSKFLSKTEKRFDRETILITGSASGIGEQVSFEFAKRFPSAKIILWDVNRKGLQATAAKCKKIGASHVFPYVVNLGILEEIVSAAAAVRKDVGKVTVLLNIAGIAPENYFLKGDAATDELVIRTNLLSYMWVIREFLPDMVRERKGHIACTSSTFAFYRYEGFSNYCASKYGVNGFLETLKMELRRYPEKLDVTVSTIFPCLTRTPLIVGKFRHKLRYRFHNEGAMDPQFVAKNIVKGILQNDEIIVVPKWARILDIAYRYAISREGMRKIIQYMF